MINNLRYKGGINMNLNDCKLIYVVSPNEDEKQAETVKDVVKELIRDDKKNRRDNIIYISSLNTFNWLSDVVDKEDRMNYSLKLLTQCSELYVLPNYELDEECNQCIGISKLLGIPITYL